nr:molybdopterin-dependent oxidoreductase [Nicoletella semolina]
MKGINAYPDPTVPKWQIPVARIADCLLNPHKPYSFNGKTHHYPNIQLIYWAGGNPFVHHQDTNRLRQAWQQAQTVIVNECYWTPTAKMADIVLPATTSFERNDLTMSGSYSQSHIFPMKQIVEPQFEAKNDYDIFAELAQRAGRFAEFTEGKTEMEWLAEIYHTARQQAVNKHPNIAMPDFATFWQQNQPMAFMPTEESTTWVKFADFRQNPTAYPLATPSGKIEICSETIANMQYLNCPKPQHG